MLKIQQIQPTPKVRTEMDCLPDRLIYQTPEWMRFIAETQDATPVWAEVRDGSSTVGYFSGLVFSRLGARILGSPFPGWTTMYMGFNLRPEVPRWMALQALEDFAFRELGCLHFEIADRYLTLEDGQRLGLQCDFVESYETDLNQTEEAIFRSMTSACRRCIRKAEKSGVVIEPAPDGVFPGEYYEQLKEVFLKQGRVPTYDQARVEALIRNLHPTGRLLLIRAKDPEGRCIATGIYPGMNRIGQFWGNASYKSGQHLRPNEALHWAAMRHWKGRDVDLFDWGGGGAYKEKYGCVKIRIPWFRKSRFALLDHLRNHARKSVYFKSRLVGWVRRQTLRTPGE